MLASFLSFLQEKDMIRIEDMPKEDDAGFENRIKAQKYVFLASRFGLPLNYDYDECMAGPYSSQLSADYSHIAENFNKNTVKPLPPTFDSDGFLRLVENRDSEWLIIATTILSMKPRFENIPALIDQVEYGEPNTTRDYIENVLTVLQKSNLAELDPVCNP